MSRANAAQAEFWSGDPGARWVAHHDDLDRQHYSIRALLMERADLRSGETVLDVGCGGGALTLSAARAVGSSGRADGIDISPVLMRLAETAGEQAGFDQARFFETDAQTFEFSERYDAVMSRFGVMFFDDPVAAFANLRRALRPGGRLVCAAWADAAANPWFGEARGGGQPSGRTAYWRSGRAGAAGLPRPWPGVSDPAQGGLRVASGARTGRDALADRRLGSD